MPYYHYLKQWIRNADERQRVVDNLIKLRAQLDKDIPPKDAEDTVLIATWNIRDFGKNPGFGHGRRSREDFFYIAEILSRFDFVAIQEINEIEEFDDYIMPILGREWQYIATDVTDRALGGNGERLTYLYDTRKIWFKNIAGELVLPSKLLISAAVETEDKENKFYEGKQFRRSPFVASFQSGWFKFDICTVHIYFGDESGDKLEQRRQEIERVASFFGKRADRSLKEGRSLILLGDFNIVHPEHETMKALTDSGFVVPKNLANPTNFGNTNYYDQIAFKAPEEVMKHIEKKGNAGVFDIFENLFRHEDWQTYVPEMKKAPQGKKKKPGEFEDYFDTWLTFHLSDHKPLWVRVNADESTRYLAALQDEV